MTVARSKSIELPAEGAELVPIYFDTERIVAPPDNPVYTPAEFADLEPSMVELGQLVPGFVCPSPDLASADLRLCLEGIRRLEVCRRRGMRFWAFDLGRFVPEEERIALRFHHHGSRRHMSREEIAEGAARYIELKGCTAAEAAKHLNISGPMLSRAFGERRIPPELRPKTDLLGLSIRSLVAAAPLELMPQVVDFALAPKADGKKPTRDQLSLHIQELKRNGKSRNHKPRAVTLRLNGRALTLAVGDKDTATTVAEDLKAIVAKLGKHADVPPDGWPFLFQ